ncbi:hypothetical protein GIS00_13820 [Nakamurella sp. YIM 132087]|uniref:Peptidase A2 domain-containing protein n=1 Tax=Nakamurella alba TaxID=2665158 RepID=A0A7K1FLJ2_9ACTN|nr:hypothetical protein [Nakamurella alba]MTD15017.1 hypothetical protein [Nakamurella alba]
MSRSRRILSLLAGAIVVAGCAGAPQAAPAISDAADDGSAVPAISFRLADDWLQNGIRIGASVSGGPVITMLTDTGSNGVVISRSYLGEDYTVPDPQQSFTGFTYSSSGNSYDGEWVLATLEFSSTVDSAGPTARTSQILVRAVDRMCNRQQQCTDDPEVAMLGVGFDREQDGTEAVESQAGPGINPFLHLEQMDAGTLDAGYSIGSGLLTLGVDDTSRSGFATVPLTQAGDDWRAPTTCIAVAGSVPPQCGTLLLDTGLPYAIVQTEDGVQPPLDGTSSIGRDEVAKGQQISVTVPDLDDTTIYDFTVGGPGAPTEVSWGHDLLARDGGAFMNISRFALSATDYLFDATTGVVGFRVL